MSDLVAAADMPAEPDEAISAPFGFCESCGGRISDQSECEQCLGDDPYGYARFCPNCDFCCGC